MSVVFDNYSKYYDLLYQDKDYSGEADYIYNLINKFSPNTKTVLELGCGTGKHSKLLKDKYHLCPYGVDMSIKMLQQAKALGNDCELGDVRTFRCDKIFDAVISLFHVISYQTTDNDVLEMFETASFHLEKNGIFIFDLWYKQAVLSQLPENRIKKMEDGEIKVVRFCTPVHLVDRSIIEVNYDIEMLDKASGHIEKLSEKHLMRYFSIDEIMNFAIQKGIEIIHTEEWLSGNSPSEKTWGVCFVGIKK